MTILLALDWTAIGPRSAGDTKAGRSGVLTKAMGFMFQILPLVICFWRFLTISEVIGMCMIDDADAADFYCEVKRTARKSHTCCECRRTIQPKEKYSHFSFGVDGSVSTGKMCGHCETAAHWLEKHCGGYLLTCVRDELEDHYEQGYREDGLQRLLIGIRRGWKAWDGDQLLPVPSDGKPIAV